MLDIFTRCICVKYSNLNLVFQMHEFFTDFDLYQGKGKSRLLQWSKSNSIAAERRENSTKKYDSRRM